MFFNKRKRDISRYTFFIKKMNRYYYTYYYIYNKDVY